MSNINWLDRYFVSAFVLDDNGVATLSPTETATSGDTVVTIRGKYGNASTTLNATTDILLPWSVSAGAVWGLEVYVTCKGTGVRRKIKISGIVYGVGAVATIDGTPDVDAKGTGTPTASLYVNGTTSAIYLRITPGAAAAFTWGYEVRAQQL